MMLGWAGCVSSQWGCLGYAWLVGWLVGWEAAGTSIPSTNPIGSIDRRGARRPTTTPTRTHATGTRIGLDQSVIPFARSIDRSIDRSMKAGAPKKEDTHRELRPAPS